MSNVTVKVTRILVYEGSPDFIRSSLSRRAVKDIYQVPDGGSITEAFLGQIPEIEVIKSIGELENKDA